MMDESKLHRMGQSRPKPAVFGAEETSADVAGCAEAGALAAEETWA